jgi:hypothetical protein
VTGTKSTEDQTAEVLLLAGNSSGDGNDRWTAETVSLMSMRAFPSSMELHAEKQ